MAHEDIMMAIQDLDKSLNCISFDTKTTKILEQTNDSLDKISISLNEISNSLNQLTIDLGNK